jgi:hypothetical protein
MRSSSTTTVAFSRGADPVQSIRKAFVKTVIIAPRSLRRTSTPSRPDGVTTRRARPPVQVVLLPQEDPRRLVPDDLAELGVGRRARLGSTSVMARAILSSISLLLP